MREQDLGVYITSDLRWKTHIDRIAAIANKVLGTLFKTFTSRNEDLWRMLYISLVRPLLEFASPVWNPYLDGDIETLERVQRRATKIPLKMKNLPYEERLRRWNLTSLKDRRTRGDIIQMYKTLNCLERISWYTGPKFAPHTSTRASNNNCQRIEREIGSLPEIKTILPTLSQFDTNSF